MSDPVLDDHSLDTDTRPPVPSGVPAAAGSGWAPVQDAQALWREALTKSGVIFLSLGQQTIGVWHAPEGATTYLVSGPGEQQLPTLPAQLTVLVPSKDSGAALVRAQMTATQLTPDSPAWDQAADRLAARRLNAREQGVALIGRWQSGCILHQLTLAGTPTLLSGSPARPQPRREVRVRAGDVEAAVQTRRPWHWGSRSSG